MATLPQASSCMACYISRLQHNSWGLITCSPSPGPGPPGPGLHLSLTLLLPFAPFIFLFYLIFSLSISLHLFPLPIYSSFPFLPFSLTLFKNRFYLLIPREKGREGERQRETSISCPSHVSQLGTKPTTQACALTWNQTSDFLLLRTMPSQLSHTAQG